MRGFRLERTWLSADDRTVAGSTFARLKISIGDTVVSAFQGHNEHPSESLELPVFYLAEWIADNWWSLLWEPRKTEDAHDEADYVTRHSLLHGQHGFALPDVTFSPLGKRVEIRAKPRNVALADVRFFNFASVTLDRRELEAELKKFVSGVVERLVAISAESALTELWRAIVSADDEEAEFCSLMGSLGLSPYAEENSTIAQIIEDAAQRFKGSALLDLCQASSAAAFEADVRLADQALTLTAEAPVSDIGALTARTPPTDNSTREAWRHGVEAAKAARAILKISETDPRGGSKFFEALGIDVSRTAARAAEDDDSPIVGAVQRDDRESRIALLQSDLPHRRFTAARAAYLAWTAEELHSARLLTMAVTRDQQASRAFAAEMMAPAAYIRLATRNLPRISNDDIWGMANALGISFDVVKKKAINSNIIKGR